MGSNRLRRALSRSRYAAVGAGVGAAIGGLFSRNAASTGAALGAFAGALVGETRVSARERLDEVRERGQEQFENVPIE